MPMDERIRNANAIMRDLMDRHDRDTEQAKEDYGERERIVCKAGCNDCCRMNVMMTPQEAFYIIGNHPQVVKESIPKLLQHEQLAKDLGVHAVDWESEDSIDDFTGRWFLANDGCAFLRDGKCGIYESRPVACRAHHMIDDPAFCSPTFVGKEVTHWEPINATTRFQLSVLRMSNTGTYALSPLPVIMLSMAAGKGWIK